MKFEFPVGSPGIHPPTAALARILASKKVNNPINDQPFSEALLLGIGGGLDVGCILFKFPHLDHPRLVLGFRNEWNNAHAFLDKLTDRMMLSVQFESFQDDKTAQNALQNILKEKKIAIVWVDKASLDYHHLPESLKGMINHQVTVYARDGRLWRLYIDDLGSKPFEVREILFTGARASLPQNNFLMMIYNNNGSLALQELQEAVLHGIQDCATQLTHPMKTIGISNLQTWAENLTNHQENQSWHQIFKNRQSLFPTLRTIYQSIRLNGSEGFALRKLYSDFLHEASWVLNNPALNAIAGQYLQLSNHWASLAENALPSKIPVFDRVKNLLNKQYKAYREFDLITHEKCIRDLNLLETKIAANFPLDDIETSQLFIRLSSQIKLIAELEMSAAYRLQDVSLR